MLATTDGLFIGSDTDRVNGEYHGRLAFFPLAGGATRAPADGTDAAGERSTRWVGSRHPAADRRRTG